MALIFRQRHLALSIGFAMISFAIVAHVLANPVGPNVTAGQAKISGLGTSAVTIQQATQQAVINWQQFNIAPNEVTRFIQPNVNSIALNRIFDQNPSQIFGSLQANGNVILLNPNGILFGPNAQVNVGGLMASSLNLTDANFLRGNYLFQGTGVEGWVKNAGSIQGASGLAGHSIAWPGRCSISTLTFSPSRRSRLSFSVMATCTRIFRSSTRVSRTSPCRTYAPRETMRARTAPSKGASTLRGFDGGAPDLPVAANVTRALSFRTRLPTSATTERIQPSMGALMSVRHMGNSLAASTCVRAMSWRRT